MGPRLRRLRLFFVVVLLLVAAYGVLGAFVLPPVARHLIVTRLEEKLGRHVTLDRVRVQPYALAAQAEGLRIYERDGRTVFASLDALDVDASIASLRYLAPVVDELHIARPRVRLVREDGERFNFSDILDRLAKAPAARHDAGEPLRFSASRVRVVDGAIDLDDRVVHGKHRMDAINIAVPFVSNLPTHLKDRVQPSFAAVVDGAPVKVAGETLPFDESLRTALNLDLRSLDTTRFVAYLPGTVPLKVDSGKLELHIAVRFSQGGGPQPAIDLAGTVRLDNVGLISNEGALAHFDRVAADIASIDPIRMRAKLKLVSLGGATAMGDTWKVPAAEAKDIEMDLLARDVRVGSVSTSGGRIALARKPDGTLTTPPVPDFGPSRGPWKVAVHDVALTGYQLDLRDETVRPALARHIDVSSLQARELSTAQGGSGHADARLQLDGGGMLQVASNFTLAPLEVKARVEARDIDLAPFRAYMTTFPAVQLKSGRASAAGDVTLTAANGATHITYAGSAQVDRFATWDSINREDLLNWKRVRASGVQLDYGTSGPLKLAVADMDVDGAYSRIFVSPQGRLNVQQLMNATADEPSPPPSAGPPAAAKRDIRVDRIRFNASRLDFTDHYIRPNYSADVGALHGSVKGLSSDPKSRATVVLEGRWDGSSPVMIAGTVNPLAGDLFLDIGAKGEGIDLTKLSTYSARYAGYRIAGGSLSLDVKYHVEGGKLQGRNRILVDQLTLGEKVDSPDATSLPVAFLINLLKDKDGRINLVLPISGSLDDPKFDVMAVVSQLFSRPLEKAQTSPFSVLAGASGDDAGASGDDLAFVEFAPGQDTLTAPAQAKLERLAKLIAEHPAVKLAIAPGPITAQDQQALKESAVQRALAAAPKDLPKEARAQIAQSVEVTPQDRQALATRRLDRVKAFFAAGPQLGERVVVSAEPAKAAPGARDASRVDFALR